LSKMEADLDQFFATDHPCVSGGFDVSKMEADLERFFATDHPCVSGKEFDDATADEWDDEKEIDSSEVQVHLDQDPMGPSGQLYRGQLVDGMKHGVGILQFEVAGYTARMVYHGEFLQNKKHGRGVLTWPSGQQYKGQFLNDDIHGDGVMTWPNGNRYVGQYVEGKKDGVGTCFFPDGSTYSGHFCRGKRHGEITRVKADGTTQLLHFYMDKLEKVNGKKCTTDASSSSSKSTPRTSSSGRSTPRSAYASTSASTCSSLSSSSLSTSQQKPQRWRVVHHGGVVVRSHEDQQGKKMGTLPKNTELTVVLVKGHRLRVLSPIAGWVTSEKQGFFGQTKHLVKRIGEDKDAEAV